ncbi:MULTISPECIES: ABC transporter ATP-binding protein [Haloarcula]|uniref:ABC transporter ATP-binding protein n=1 Tax=Haloarcula TaxID=2237 RepID=UPI0023EADB3A|nr:ABC transporter ATP-binding protein [Halomicroarcula sp. XH51]
MALIELSDVRFNYRVQPDDEFALDGVSLSIEEGAFVGVTGPSDAGKSTLGRLLASYIPNYFEGTLEGSAVVGDQDVTETSIADMSDTVGLLFENPFDQLTGASTTVFEEVAFGLENMGVPREELIEISKEKLELTGISHLYDRNPQQLSGGQSQRLALASMLAMEPDVLVLDEPTSQLDPHGTEEVMQVIADLAAEGYTVVTISHDLAHLAPHLDRLLVVEEGQIAENDEPRTVFRNAESEWGFEVPATAVIGERLRELGKVPNDEPLPLTLEEVVAELSPHIDDGQPPLAPDLQSDGAGTSVDMGSAGIQFDDVHFYYDEEVHALRGIDLDLDAGCVCVIGQNGAGKSTFLKHLNGLLEPSEGKTTVNGLDTADHNISELAGEVALAFQNPNNQLFHNSIEAEVRYGPKNLGYDSDRIDELVDDAIQKMDLTDIRKKNPYDVGLARRKHIAVASVLAMDTPIVALDEPTGSQDVLGIDLLGDVVEMLVDEGKLVVVITHDVEFARDHGDRILALNQGDLLLDGPVRTVFGQEEQLARTDVKVPFVTRLASELGLSETVLTVDELFEYVK